MPASSPFDDSSLQSALLDLEAPQFVDLNKMLKSSPQFHLGAKQASTSIHVQHTHVYNALVHGRKKWLLIPPRSGVQLYNGGMHNSENTLRGWQNSEAYANMHRAGDVVECIQDPGDVLYIPTAWSFGAVNLAESVAYGMEFHFADGFPSDGLEEAVPEVHELGKEDSAYHAFDFDSAIALLQERFDSPSLAEPISKIHRGALRTDVVHPASDCLEDVQAAVESVVNGYKRHTKNRFFDPKNIQTITFVTVPPEEKEQPWHVDNTVIKDYWTLMIELTAGAVGTQFLDETSGHGGWGGDGADGAADPSSGNEDAHTTSLAPTRAFAGSKLHRGPPNKSGKARLVVAVVLHTKNQFDANLNKDTH